MSSTTIVEQERLPSAQEPNTDLPAASTDATEPQPTMNIDNQNPSINGTMQVEQTGQEQHGRAEQTEPTLPTQDAEMTNAP